MPRISSLVLTSFILTACTSENGGSETSDTTDTSNTDSQPTGGVFTPEGGDYELTPGVNSGSCAAGNEQQFAVHFVFASVTAEDGGFSLAIGHHPDEMDVLDCTLVDQEFTCTGSHEFEAFIQSDPDASAVVTSTAVGRWTATNALELTITGSLACTGDPVGCGETAAKWGLEMPCDMINVHTGEFKGVGWWSFQE